ncbi:MAG: IS630 family transposase [Firmicutes bacterium]|nr:IS630 family transposase [Bacillota bacterium]
MAHSPPQEDRLCEAGVVPRHGTVSLLAGLDLATGEVIGLVRDRHRNHEFVEFLQTLDAKYPENVRIQVILDNHSAHTSKETRAYLATVPNWFEFVFTPLHGSWLNLIEVFFAKMTHQVLRHIQVASKAELVQRLELYLREVNDHPVQFRWTHFTPLETIVADVVDLVALLVAEKRPSR